MKNLKARLSGGPVPFLVRLQGLVLVAVVLATLTVSAVVNQRVTERAAFAVPAADALSPWRDQVATFADRLERVFRVQSMVASEFSGWILEASQRHDLNPELLASVVFTESSFRKDVVSHAGAIGPAQVQPFWRSFCGATTLTDPAENIYCGAQILAHLRDVCGDERCALSAYNVGLRNHRESEEFQQAGQRYIRKVHRHLESFQNHQVL
ncbi:MAG: lytic transglycosylase domain-containing protein [Gammaproteobacteria bacterium]|nr:lytic transglycosylase domain-containing protein [Gammaproteobacteria bacterium]